MRIPQIIMGAGLVVLFVLLLTPQRRPPGYDVAAQVTLQGVVNDVREFYCPISGDVGTHLNVATSNGIVEVHVAPSRFLRGKQWQFSPGDQIEVTGSRVLYHGHPALIAQTIVRGSQTVALRQANGRPMWKE
jgi:hypothetical protein